jgi:hypothetical protein
MKLSAHDQFTVSAALATVQASSADLAKVRDTEAAKSALLAVRHAAIRAYAEITEAEKRTREAAEPMPFRNVA